MMKKLLTGLLILNMLCAFGQERTYHDDVLAYFQVNGTAQQYQDATNGLFDLLKRQYENQNVPNEVWNELQKDSPKYVSQVLNMLVSAYRGSYSQEDINNMLNFYNTPAGRQLLLDKTALDYEQQKKVSSFYNTPTGMQIQTVELEIVQNISEISEIWSRDLYRLMVNKLAEKGYTM